MVTTGKIIGGQMRDLTISFMQTLSQGKLAISLGLCPRQAASEFHVRIPIQITDSVEIVTMRFITFDKI